MTGMERVYTLTELVQKGQLPVGFDGRVAELVMGCCGLGQHRRRRWNLERVKNAAICLMAAEL